LAEIRELLAEQRRSADRLIVISQESYDKGFLLQVDLLSSRLLSAEVQLGVYDIQETWGSSFLALKTLTGIEDLEPLGILLPSREYADRESLRYSPADKTRLFPRLMAENPGLKMLSLQTQAHEKALLQLETSLYRQEYMLLKAETSAAQKDQAETAWKSGHGEEREFLIRKLAWYGDRITLLREELNALVIALQLENVIGE
jgi:outer membrane protein TolC